jgi:gas vesicle protein
MPVAVAGFFFAAGTVGFAVTSAAVTGVLVGAAIGAATSIITKKPILQGVLTGALIGGITGGAAAYLSAPTTAATTGASAAVDAGAQAASNAAATSAGMGSEIGANTVIEGGVQQTGVLSSGGAAGTVAGSGGAGSSSVDNGLSATDRLVASMRADSLANQAQLAKYTIGSGIVSGLGQAGGAIYAANRAEDTAEKQAEERKNLIAGNVAYDQGRTLWTNITIPQIWTDRMTPTNISAPINRYARPGLLEGGVA